MAFKSDGVLDAIFYFGYFLMLLVQTDADIASSVALFALHVLSSELIPPTPFHNSGLLRHSSAPPIFVTYHRAFSTSVYSTSSVQCFSMDLWTHTDT